MVLVHSFLFVTIIEVAPGLVVNMLVVTAD